MCTWYRRWPRTVFSSASPRSLSCWRSPGCWAGWPGASACPAIVGELATGVILGPSLLLHVLPGVSHWLFPADANQLHLLDGIAQVGAVLLVGVTGTQLDLRLLRRMGGTALTVSGLNLITPLASLGDLGLKF